MESRAIANERGHKPIGPIRPSAETPPLLFKARNKEGKSPAVISSSYGTATVQTTIPRSCSQILPSPSPTSKKGHTRARQCRESIDVSSNGEGRLVRGPAESWNNGPFADKALLYSRIIAQARARREADRDWNVRHYEVFHRDGLRL